MLEALEILTLDGSVIPADAFNQLSNLSRLRRIHMVDVDLQPCHLDGLVRLPALEAVVVRTKRQGEFVDSEFIRCGRERVSVTLER